MDFSFSEEQTLLRNSLSRYLADNYAYEDWRKFTRDGEGRDPAHWRQFAEMGLLAAPLPEALGGLGGGAIESLVVMEEFGRALVVEPFVPTVVIAGGLLAKAGGPLAQKEWLPRIAGGETIMAFAFAEAQGRFNLADLTTTAKKQGDNMCFKARNPWCWARPGLIISSSRPARGRRGGKRPVSAFSGGEECQRRFIPRLCGDERLARQRHHLRECAG